MTLSSCATCCTPATHRHCDMGLSCSGGGCCCSVPEALVTQMLLRSPRIAGGVRQGLRFGLPPELHELVSASEVSATPGGPEWWLTGRSPGGTGGELLWASEASEMGRAAGATKWNRLELPRWRAPRATLARQVLASPLFGRRGGIASNVDLAER